MWNGTIWSTVDAPYGTDSIAEAVTVDLNDHVWIAGTVSDGSGNYEWRIRNNVGGTFTEVHSHSLAGIAKAAPYDIR